MKKINYLLLLFAIVITFSLQARQVVVNTAATFKTAFNAAQDKDTISLKPGTYSMSNGLRFPVSGLCVVQSTNKDSMAIIQAQILAAADDSINHRSLIFRNIHIQGRYGNYITNSSYILDLNNRVFPFDTLAFRNCEISQNSRCIVRSGLDKGWTSGNIELLEMTNCYLHHMNSAANQWSLFYLGHIPTIVNFKNNTFFDMPYCKSILSFRSMPTLSGRNSEIDFTNNTLAITYAQTTGVINSASYLGEETTFNIKNNAFILPNWSNELNMSPDSVTKYKIPAIVRCVRGIISTSNNLVDRMDYWLNGQILDVDGQGGFLVIDTVKTYSMSDLNVSWSDFANPKAGDFSYLSTNPLATAGTGGGPIGDPRWVKSFTNPRTLTASANIEGAVVTPAKAFYENGAQVTVKASVVDGYTFNGWKKVSDGSLLSTDYSYTFNITSDIALLADYKVLQPRAVSITISGSNSASYTITPKKDIYFDGDVITVAINTHGINDFIGWSDNNKDWTRTITLSSDLTLTATFHEHPYVVAWDFSQLTANNQTFSHLAANFASTTTNPGYMNYVMTDTIRTISTRNNKFTGDGFRQINCLARRTNVANFANPDYVYIRFSTKGLTNLKVKCDYGTDNSIFPVQKMQYSKDGVNYTNFATDTLTEAQNQIWRHFEGVLPVAAENQDSISVRWIADTSAGRLFIPGLDETSSTIEYVYIGNIVVINSTFTSTKDLDFSDMYKIYAAGDKLYVRAQSSGKAEVFTLMGQKLKESALNLGLNEFTGLKTGIYIVRIGSVVQKVQIK